MSAATMKAVRAVDALVAERVMGLKREVRLAGTTEVVTAYSNSPWWQDGYRTLLDVHRHGGPRPYSTDIAAAWEVVEAMKARGFDFQIRNFSHWTAEFFTPTNAAGVDDADAAPLAICRAALEAVA